MTVLACPVIAIIVELIEIVVGTVPLEEEEEDDDEVEAVDPDAPPEVMLNCWD